MRIEILSSEVEHLPGLTQTEIDEMGGNWLFSPSPPSDVRRVRYEAFDDDGHMIRGHVEEHFRADLADDVDTIKAKIAAMVEESEREAAAEDADEFRMRMGGY